MGRRLEPYQPFVKYFTEDVSERKHSIEFEPFEYDSTIVLVKYSI